mmetsp:Transcript_8153/g.13553  ORF Transcript_8153/g.13553 Transcript_8153/m.13553 type:complete len:239 (+) Transcript_8153:154-870(+)
MLTNRQLWRKQQTKTRNSNENIPGLEVFEPNSLSTSTSWNSSHSMDSSSDSSPAASMQYSKNVKELGLPKATLKDIKKKLRFDKVVKVTLIPSIAEYKDAGLQLTLWCSQNELQCYKSEAYGEIQEYMRSSQCNDISTAMKSLFQVNPSMADSDTATRIKSPNGVNSLNSYAISTGPMMDIISGSEHDYSASGNGSLSTHSKDFRRSYITQQQHQQLPVVSACLMEQHHQNQSSKIVS